MKGLSTAVLAAMMATAASQLILPPPVQSGPAWTALPKKIASIEDTCRMKDMEPTRRQCMRPSCFKVMPKANKRFCCCAAKASGWSFKSMGKCSTKMECPSQLPSHLTRMAPSLRDQLTYQNKLSGCAGFCVHQCATAQVAATLQANSDAAMASVNATAGAALLEVGSPCEDKCIEHCLETAAPSVSLASFLQTEARFTGRTASPVARKMAADFAEIQQHMNNEEAVRRVERAKLDDASPPKAAHSETDKPNAAAPNHELKAPTYANQARFSGARAAAKSQHAAAAREGKGADWWQEPPSWWLPAPPEIGGPPPAVFNNLHSPYAAGNTFGTYGGGVVQNAQPFFASMPAPY